MTVVRIAALASLLAGAVLSAQPHPAQSRSAQPIARAVARTVAKPVAKPVANPGTPADAKPIGRPSSVTIEREVFAYGGVGRRDPFKSLLTSTELRPAIVDLRLVAVAFDPTGASVAILRNVNTKEQHRVRVGTSLGRMRVAAIRPKAVVFTIEELGYSRQETLGLNDSTAVRSK